MRRQARQAGTTTASAHRWPYPWHRTVSDPFLLADAIAGRRRALAHLRGEDVR
ncbi:hypothetical protein [Kutzneria albida]|uniref:Uncharacterized protein n=1 Tax=Kutzneria albida DSM 43870 TaxID=1449976 RepID=W5WQ32_9PSEU|nr:hypothetical protein [Kutzneria albida]AHI00290.1 hypothetical protein KALB_6931 [Kutzneria albida DSM 43870]